MQKSLRAPTAKDCLVRHRMSSMRRGRGGCCWLLMIKIAKWPQTIKNTAEPCRKGGPTLLL